MDYRKIMKEITNKAKKATASLSAMSAEDKNRVLREMADELRAQSENLKKANKLDLVRAEKDGKSKAFIDRLTLDDNRINAMVKMMEDVAALKDPIGTVIEDIKRPNGLEIRKVRVPIGVIGIIYEARPNVTADSVALCFKAGNSVILRGGTGAINSNKAIADILKKAADKNGVVDGAFVLLEDTSRELVDAMLESSEGMDLIMPRGGESLIREVVSKSKVPVIKHYKGICHVYVDDNADLDMAQKICFNAKVQRPGVCNAMETMLVHEAIAEKFLPSIADKLTKKGVRLKGCKRTLQVLGNIAESADDKDYATEWLDLVLNVRVVDSMAQAIAHIAKFGSHHSDAIVTQQDTKAEEFVKIVDSAAVYVNASTRFTDGGEFGKGAEIGISTDKIHARGPMGLEELTSYKYIVFGKGQIRE
ncbi:MAG: glutamate-5-semialdehyde dehydrogenase [Candidatus Omnitrophota bacterium]